MRDALLQHWDDFFGPNFRKHVNRTAFRSAFAVLGESQQRPGGGGLGLGTDRGNRDQHFQLSFGVRGIKMLDQFGNRRSRIGANLPQHRSGHGKKLGLVEPIRQHLNGRAFDGPQGSRRGECHDARRIIEGFVQLRNRRLGLWADCPQSLHAAMRTSGEESDKTFANAGTAEPAASANVPKERRLLAEHRRFRRQMLHQCRNDGVRLGSDPAQCVCGVRATFLSGLSNAATKPAVADAASGPIIANVSAARTATFASPLCRREMSCGTAGLPTSARPATASATTPESGLSKPFSRIGEHLPDGVRTIRDGSDRPSGRHG